MPQADTAVNEEVEADSTAADSTPEENKTEVVEVTPSANGEYTAEDVKTDSEKAEKQAAEETEAESQPQGEKELSPKSENRFQQLANDNRELKAEIDRLKSQEAQIATEQGLLAEINPETGEYYTTQEIERIAFQESRELQQQAVAQQRYDLEVQQNQQIISGEANQVLQEFPMFDETSADYDAERTADYEQLLGQSLIVQDGKIVGSNLSPYQLAKTIATSAKAGAAKGQIKAQKSTEKMMANADATGSSQQGESSFEKLSLKEMEAKLRRQGYDI